MKKLIAALAVAALPAVAALAWESSVLKTNTINGVEFVTEWHYELSDSLEPPRTATLLWVDGAVGDETIPNVLSANGVVWNVTRVADSALANNPGLLKVEIPNTILEIGAYAFSNCTALAEVTLNYGIRYIGERAFVNTIVREIKVPDSLLDMGGNISAGTLFTTSINIDDSSHFKYSEDGVLYNRDMTKLYACPARAEGTVTIANTVTNIATDAFFGCHRLSYLNIPASVKSIGSGAFNVAGIWPGLAAPESTPKLLSIFYNGRVPDAEDDIYAGAPAGLVSYALDDDWEGMSTWKEREVKPIDGTNPPTLSYTDETGITWSYRIANSEVEIYNEDASGNPTTAISPASTSGVAYKEGEESTTFRRALKIPEAINGFAVTKIGSHAFDGCAALSCLGIPASVREIGDFAFNGCTAIASIGASDDVPFSVTENSIVLPTGIAKLGCHPFEGLKVSSVSLPYTLSEFDGNPVAGCAYVTSLSVDSACPSFYSEGNVLYNRKKDTVIAVPANYDGSSVSFLDSVTTIGAEALVGCKNLSQIQIPESIETIGARAFSGCESVKSLALPDTLDAIGEAAFSGCTSLEKVTYARADKAPDAADDIYDGANESLVSYVIAKASGFSEGKWKDRDIVFVSEGDDPSDNGDDAELSFRDLNNVTWRFRIVDGVAEIWHNGTTAVSSADPIMGQITPPATLGGYVVKGIGDGALSNLRGITAITIPSTYEWIGGGAFSNCTSLASVTLVRGLRTIGRHPFAGTGVEAIALPDTVSSIDGNILFGCDPSVSLDVGEDNLYFATSEEGALYDKNFTTLLAVPMTAESLDIPATTTNIADDAFAGCTKMKSLVFAGNAPTAADGILADTPETMKITVLAGSLGWNGNPASDAIPSSGRWRNRPILEDDLGSTKQVHDDGTVKWTYDIVKGKAVITGASGEAETVTIPATLDGHPVSNINAGALDGLSGVKAYKSESSLYKTRNGCLYSADGKTLIRVPDSMELPYIVTTEVISNTFNVTVIPRLRSSNNPGNDGSEITTNILSRTSTCSTNIPPVDITIDKLFDGVTSIADYAFHGCNNFSNSTETVTEDLGGETGFIGSSAYVRTKTREITKTVEYVTSIRIPSTVRYGYKAFDESGVTATKVAQASSSRTTHSTTTVSGETNTDEILESTSYNGWISNNGTVVGTATVKASKKRNGVLQISGSAVRIGERKRKVKSMNALEELGDVHLVKDLSKSKSAADKSHPPRVKGFLRTWAAVLVHDDGVFLLGVEVARQNHPSVQLHALRRGE